MRSIVIAILAVADISLIAILGSEFRTFVKSRHSWSERARDASWTHRLMSNCAGAVHCLGMVLSVLLVVAATYVLWYVWDSSRNRGLAFGYYGEFNTVSQAMATLPGITVLGSGCNRDISLEEFGFTLQTDQGQKFEIWFQEDDPIRKMTGKGLSVALQERVNKELAAQPALRTELNRSSKASRQQGNQEPHLDCTWLGSQARSKAGDGSDSTAGTTSALDYADVRECEKPSICPT